MNSTMRKYGIQHMDPDVLFLISDALKNKYSSIIQELIDISRSSQSNSYLSSKSSMPKEITEVHVHNQINKNRLQNKQHPG